MIVRIIKNWDQPDIMRQTPNCSKKWNNIEFTEEPIMECDLVVVLNAVGSRSNYKALSGIKCREAWLFAQEPPIEQQEWTKQAHKDFDKVFTFWNNPSPINNISDQTSLPWHINKTYDDLKSLTLNSKPVKTKTLSAISSNLTSLEGHKIRFNFINHLKNINYNCDFYGKGSNFVIDKFDALSPYKYSIAIENYSCNDYWTEKISDCFLSYTMPIYFGSKNIVKYFPEESIIFIDPSYPEKSIDIINKAIEDDKWDKNFEYIQKARALVLDHYQFFPHVCELISKYNISDVEKRIRS